MSRAAALASLHVAVALFGVAALFGKWLDASPFAIVLGRTVVAAVTLALVARLAHERLPRPRPLFLGTGALLAVHWVAFFAAVQLASVAVALLGFASFPVFVLLIDRARGRGPVALADLATLALVAGGIALLVMPLDAGTAAVPGLAAGVFSGFTFALLLLANRGLVRRLSPTGVAFWQNACAGALLLPLVLGTDVTLPAGPLDWALVVVLGVACTALAHTLYIGSLRRVSATTASVVALLEPVYGIGWAALLLGEMPSLRTLAGAALILVAAVVATRRDAVATPALAQRGPIR